ncbi:BspA family leucine-rich repeat surface protein [uncultured Winogradskyella sp.]|uniref:BspA family leucine-rich repeat surface protein n=1 Tax=uncultured Winogradskyella sp. TaxID=395353 RepID=UPI00262A621C|nr:BspA family leucine-rich repeat surface protein [uncultured Winogradskyella sp.]
MKAKTPLITLVLFIFFFSLQSVEAQIARCKDITVALDVNGQASIDAQDINDNSSSGGVAVTYSINVSTFDCSNLGENTVQLTVSGGGNSSSCNAIVTVISGNYADLQCSDYIIGNDPGQSFAIISPADFDGSNITINDNAPCPSDTFTGSYSASGFGFSYFIGQPREVTYTYTNNYGEEQSCTFNVIVNDTEAPVLGGCPTTDVVLLEGEILQEPSLTGSSDNYDANSQLVIERLDAGPAFGTVPTSDFTVQYRIVDTSGNESSICSYNVVIDNAPVITCSSPSVIVDESTSTYEFTLNELANATNDLSATANLAFGTGTEVSVVLDNNSPTDQILNIPTGFHYQLFELIPPTTGSYTFTLSGNNSSNLFIWEDSFNPNTGDFAARPGYVGFASFNANGSLAQGSNNNTFTLQRDKTYYMSVIEDGEDLFFTGTLAFSSELIYLNGASSITLDLDCSDAGTIIPTNRVYAYEDNGQNTSCVPSVNATDNIAPVFIGCPADITAGIDPNSAGAIVIFTLSATDNCITTEDLQISQTSGLGSGELFPIGETIQTFTVTDASGNTDECTFTITVEDTEAPTISCQDVTVPQLPTTDIGYNILPSDFDNGSTDNSSQLDFLAENDQFYVNIDNTSPVHSNLYHQSSIFMVPSNGAYKFNFDLNKNDEGSGTFVPQFRYSIWNIPPTENGEGLIADTTIDIATGQVVSGNTTTTLSAGVKYYMHVYAASSTSTTFENLTGTMSVDTSISSSLPMFINCSTVNIDDVTITAVDVVGNTDTCTASVSVSNISCPIELIISPTANQDFQLPFMPYTGETYSVDWGDGTSTTGHTGYTNHNYALAAEYTIKVYGNISYFRFSDVDLNDANAPILKSVVSWGDNVWETMLEAFNGCSNLESLPVTPPNLSNVTNMNHMFARASIFNQDISNWDVSNVTDMEGTFAATIFNQPLNGWNVSNVTTMEGMFLSAIEFNQPLNNWNVSNVINMDGMFLDAYAFNGDITTWNTSNLVNANGMFATASSFNQNLGTWDISSLNNAFAMFSNTSLSTTNYDNLLIGWANLDAGETQIPTGTAFDAPQSRYCNGEAARTELMSTYGWAISDGDRDPFCGVIEEELFITEWNANGNRIIEIPTNENGYNYSIDWGDGTFSYNQTGNVSHEYTSTGQYDVKIYGDFPRIHFESSTSTNRTKIREVKQWGAIEWSSMAGAFLECSNLKVTATDIPNLSNVTNTSSMFKDCTSLTENDMFNNWDMSNVSNMNNMFESATNLDQNVGNWDIASLVTANNMFTDTALSTDNYDALLIGWSTQEAGEGSIPNSVSFNANGYTYCNGENARLNLLFNNFWNIFGDGPDQFCGLGRPFITEWQLTGDFQTIEIPTTGSGYDYVIDWGDGSDFEGATVEYDQTGDASHQYDIPGTYVIKIYGDFPRIDFSSSTGVNKSKIRKVTQWGDIQWSTMLNAFTECNNLSVTASDTPDLSNVTSLQGMFNSCTFLVGNDSFNNWDVSNVSNMINMFNNAFSFNQNIDNWDITSLDNASSMFGGVTLSTENYDALLIGWSTQEVGEGPIPSNVNFNAGNSRYCNGEIERARLITNFSWSIDDGQQDPTCGLISEPFITTWNTDISGTSNSSSIIIPTFTGEVYNYTVLWGDGTLDEGLTGNATHEYATPGVYEVKIYGDFPRIDFNSSTSANRAKIIEVTNWGINEWTTMENAFFDCGNLNITALDVPNLSNASNLSSMFFNCTNFNSDINNWDVSNITNMQAMFYGCTNFNQPLNNWNVSNVTNMSGLFIFSSSFNQPLNNWDVSNVTNMNFMFNNAISFDQNLGEWDITSLDFINSMFNGVKLSTENYDALLIGWATQEVGEGPIPTDLEFNAGDSRYCNGEAARTELMSTYSWGINDDGLDFSCNFLPFITKWIVENGQSIIIPTTGTGYNYYIDWGDGTIEENLTGDASHAYAIAGEYEVKIYGDFPRITFGYLGSVSHRQMIREITQWGDIEWTSMEQAFFGCTNLNVTATDIPDLSQVTNAYAMFASCRSLTGNSSFNNWDVSNITNMEGMFAATDIFNQDIGNWNVSNVTNMSSMFLDCYFFNQDIGNWDVSNVTDMSSMFYSVFNSSVILPFDQDLSNWDITSLENTTLMFRNLALSTENYDALLIGWSTQEAGEGPIPTGISFYPGLSYYCNGGSARTELMSTYGWGINDSGLSPICGLTESPFITRWENILAFETLTIPTMGDGYNYIVDWGDGTIDAGITGDASHDYITEDIYADVQERIVKIYGDFPRIDFSNSTDEIKAKIKEVVQWGDIEWTSMETAFSGCSNLIVTTSDTPDLSNVTNTEGMFSGCQLLVGNDSFNNWDVSNITNMDHMFNGCIDFNQPLNNWDVSNVVGMSSMFASATSFDQNLGDWDITSLVSGTEMFSGVTLSTENYDALLIGWSTQDAGEGPIPSDINLVFDAGNSKYCEGVHARNLLVESVSNGGYGWTINDLGIENPICGLGNPFITKWNVGANESITIPTTGSGYNYVVDWGDGIIESNLTGNASHTYATTDTYEVKIYGDFPRIYFFPSDQSNRNKLETIEQWGDIEWTSMFAAFYVCENLKITNLDIDEPDLSNVTNTESMFVDCINFDSDISNWDVSNVIYMDHMFNGCISFNQPLNNWDVSNVIGMSNMFSGATSFDQNLGDWDITNLQFGAGMFTNVTLSTENYDALLIGWSTQEAGEGPIPTDLELDAGNSQYCLGGDAKTLLEESIVNGGYNWNISDGDQDPLCIIDYFITKWNVGAGESITIPTTLDGYNYTVDWGDGTIDEGLTGNASHTYASAGEYEVKISGDFPRIFFNNSGDKSKITEVKQWGSIEWTSMESAFYGCNNIHITAIDAPDLSSVTSMKSMFRSTPIDEDISHWDVSNVEDMGFLFRQCVNFNSDISSWNVSSVNSFATMFTGASQFNQDLSTWDVSNATIIRSMFNNASQFNQDLSTWDISNVTDANNIFSNTNLSTENYDAILIGWSTLDTMAGETAIPNGILFGAENIKYCLSETERTLLMTPVIDGGYGWTITDGDQDTSCVRVLLSPKVYLQGASLNANTGEESLMRDDLRVNGLIPLTSPYGDAAIVEATVLTTMGTDAIVDWVWVELRDKDDNSIVIDSQSALLHRDGDVVTIDGTSALAFNQPLGSYYVVVNHRNHIGIMTASAVSLSSTTTTVDLSSDANTVAGGTNSVILLDNGSYGMYTGDYDANAQIQNTDASAVIQLIGGAGYDEADMDFNTQVQNTDVNALINPNIGRGQQFSRSTNSMTTAGITLAFANAEITNDGVDNFYEADIVISSTEAIYVGSGQVYFDYNTAAFGENVSANTNIEYSQPSGSILGFAWPGVPFATPAYKDFIQNDNTISRVSLSFQQNIALVGLETEPDALEVNSTAKVLFHIKIKYIDSSEDANMCFYSDGVFQDQFFTACGGTSVADCTGAPGLQITDDSYDCTDAGVGTLSITDHDITDLVLYPNPTRTSFYIKGISIDSMVKVYDINGRLITKQNIVEDQAIDMSRYEDGMYMVEITSGTSTVIKRLIKKH